MTTTTTTIDIPEEDLRCEYFAKLSGRFVDVVCLKGAFDMPMALRKGCLGGGFYRGFCVKMLTVVVGHAVADAYNEYCREQVKLHHNPPAPDQIDQPAESLKPLHEKLSEDDLYLETAIRVFGRNIEVVSQNCSFPMIGAVSPSLLEHYRTSFRKVHYSLFLVPIQIKLNIFFDERQAAYEKSVSKYAPPGYTDNEDWNFGSESLASAMEQERQQPAREAA